MNFLNRLSISIFIIFCLITTSNAQGEYKEGYIITSQNDSISGLIQFRSDIKNCQFCIFKLDKSTQAITYSPDELKAYRFSDNTYFIQKKITKDSVQKTVFVEYLVDGKVDLFYYSDVTGSLYLIEDENKIQTMLEIRSSVITDEENKNYLFDFKEYVGILKITFKDTPELFPLIEKSKLSHHSMVGVLKKYHDANSYSEKLKIYAKDLKLIKIGFGLYTAFVSNKINVFEGKFDVPFEKDNYQTYGFYTDIKFPQMSENLSLNISCDIGKLDFNYQEQHISQLTKFTNNYLISAKPISFNGGIKYTFPSGKIKPFIILGISKLYLNDLSTYKSIKTEFVSGHEIIKEFTEVEVRDFLNGIYCSTGIYYYNKKAKKIAELKLEYKNLKEESNKPTTSMKIISIGLGINLF